MSITQASDIYEYRSYLETLLIYGMMPPHLISQSRLVSIRGRYASLLPYRRRCQKRGFHHLLDRIKQSKEVQPYGRLHCDIWNVLQYLIPGARLQIKLTKAQSSFYLMNKSADSKSTFKFLDAKLFVKSIRPKPDLLSTHNNSLKEGANARYNSTRVELKTFAFRAALKSLSIDNFVLGPIPKRRLFTMVKHTDFLVSLNTILYNCRHYVLSRLIMFVNGK